jgi:Prokaryotic Cytochrome C oxidase subunit IV
MITESAPRSVPIDFSKYQHSVPLWGLFLALLALTSAEVGLFEVWNRTKEVDPSGVITWSFIPKYALVLLILMFTIPKALIVLIYFMHLKFEKLTVVGLAISPFIFASLAVLPTLTDTLTLRPRAHNAVPALRTFGPPQGEAGHHGDEHGKGAEGGGEGDKKPAPAKPDPNDPFS